MKIFEQRLRPLGFGFAYLPVAVALEETGMLSQKDLAQLVGVEQPTMAILLARMERDGLIIRSPDAEDKRSRKIKLTDKAKEQLPLAKARLYEVVNLATADMTLQEQKQCISLLKKMIMNLDTLHNTNL